VARQRAREIAFQTLFQAERGGLPLLDVWQQVRGDLQPDSSEGETEELYGSTLAHEAIRFADQLISVYAEHQQEIELQLTGLIEGWSFSQMAQTDLNVLRLAVTELLFAPEIPKEVTIEMAVRTAKKFGGEESGRFVNGVLAKLYKKLAATPLQG
jgi:N utilization substance protein B